MQGYIGAMNLVFAIGTRLPAGGTPQAKLPAGIAAELRKHVYKKSNNKKKTHRGAILESRRTLVNLIQIGVVCDAGNRLTNIIKIHIHQYKPCMGQ